MNGKPADELIEAAKRHAPHDAELEQALRDIGALEGNKPKPTGTLPEKIKQAKETTAKHTLQFGEGERCEVCGTQLPGGQMDGVCQACRTVDKYGPEFGGD